MTFMFSDLTIVENVNRSHATISSEKLYLEEILSHSPGFHSHIFKFGSSIQLPKLTVSKLLSDIFCKKKLLNE